MLGALPLLALLGACQAQSIPLIRPDYSYAYPVSVTGAPQQLRARVLHEASGALFLLFAQCSAGSGASACLASFAASTSRAPYLTLVRLDAARGTATWQVAVAAAPALATPGGSELGPTGLALSASGATVLVSYAGALTALDASGTSGEGGAGTVLWSQSSSPLAWGLPSSLQELNALMARSQGVALSGPYPMPVGPSPSFSAPYVYFNNYQVSVAQTARLPNPTLPMALAAGFLVASTAQPSSANVSATFSFALLQEASGSAMWTTPALVPVPAGAAAYYAFDAMRTTMVLLAPSTGVLAFVNLVSGAVAYPAIPPGQGSIVFSTTSGMARWGTPVMVCLTAAPAAPALLGGPFNASRTRAGLVVFSLPSGAVLASGAAAGDAALAGTVPGALSVNTAFASVAGLGSYRMGIGSADPAVAPPSADLPLYDANSYSAALASPSLLMQALPQPLSAGATPPVTLATKWQWELPAGGFFSPAPQLGTPGSMSVTSFGPVTTGTPCDATARTAKVAMRVPISTAPNDPSPALLVPTYRTLIAPPPAGSLATPAACAATGFLEFSRVLDVTTTMYLVDAASGATVWASPARPAAADANPALAQNLLISPACALGVGSFVLQAVNSSGSVLPDPSAPASTAPGALRSLWGLARTGGYSWSARVDYSSLLCGNASFVAFGAGGLTRFTPPASAAKPYAYDEGGTMASRFVAAPLIGMVALVFFVLGKAQ